MRTPVECAQLLSLGLGRLPGFRRLFYAVYDLSLGLAVQLLRRQDGVSAVMLRGSWVTKNHIPGLSDLDLQLIMEPGLDPHEKVGLVTEAHRRVSLLQPLFPFLQSPFIHEAREFDIACEVPNEWLSHSDWATLWGATELVAPALDRKRTALALFRLCFRELTKTLPRLLMHTPRDGRWAPARTNPDRLQSLARLGHLLETPLPELEPMHHIYQQLQNGHFLSRRARSVLARYHAYQYLALQRLADPLLRLAGPSTAVAASSELPVIPDLLHEYRQRLHSRQADCLLSTAGCRFAQHKVYLIPKGRPDADQLSQLICEALDAWQELDPDRLAYLCLSYRAPIVLPPNLLQLTHLGLSSAFEAYYLRRAAATGAELAFQDESLKRELVDGIFLLRKKVDLQRKRSRRFAAFLLDYFVGVYPALALALRRQEYHCAPLTAARSFCDHYPGDYAAALAPLLAQPAAGLADLVSSEPLSYLILLEQLHGELLERL